MMQRLGASRVGGDCPHILERFIQVFGRGIADFHNTRIFVFSLFLQIIGCRPVAAPDMAFDNQSGFRPFAKVSRIAA